MLSSLKAFFANLAKTESQQNWLVVLLVILITCVCFANALSGEFVYDDFILIQDNPNIKSLSNIPKLFFQTYWAMYPGIGCYRPLTNISFALNFAISETNVYSYHLLSIFIHCLNCLLIYSLCNHYLKRKLLALFCALLFAAHPIHSEAVTAIYGRPEILASFFLLAAWISYTKESNKFYILSLISYFLSLLCKESGIVFVGILWLLQICTESSWKDKLIPRKKLFGYLILTIPYIIIRTLVTGSVGVNKSGQFFANETFFTRLFTMSLGYLKYFEILIWPRDFSADYDYNLIPKATSLSIIVILTLLLILAIIVVGFWQINRNPVIAFSILFFFGTTSVVSNIIIPTGILIAERVIYLASISICLLAAAFFYYIYDLGWKKLSISIFLITLALASIKTYYRNLDFKDNITFYNALLRVSPSHLKATFSLGQCYESKDPVKAEVYFKKAVEIGANFSTPHIILAGFYLKIGRDSEVLPLLNKAISLSPKSDSAHRVLARYYKKNKEYKKSVEAFLIAINNSSPNAQLEQELAVVLYEAGEIEQATIHFEKAVNLDPSFSEPLINLAKIAQRKGQGEKASELLTKVLKLEPNNAEANNLWGAKLLSEGNLCEAKVYLTKAVDFDKKLFEAQSNLGVLYAQMNLYSKARSHFELALTINPDYLAAKQNLALLDERKNPKDPPINCP